MDRGARLSAVHAWQRYYNMEPRSDSKLTGLYADGAIDWPPEQVARELVATEFLYAETLYGNLLEEFLRVVAARLRTDVAPGLAWPATWEIVRFYGPTAFKLLNLEYCGLRIPDRLRPLGDDGASGVPPLLSQ